MSTDHADSRRNDEQDERLERIADPEDYAKRRRLRQLYDARERVRDTKDRAHDLALTDRQVTANDRDQIIAEALVDYIAELYPILARRDGDDEAAFLGETVTTITGAELTIEEIREQRGRVERDERREPINYETAMRAWEIANQYFEAIAGATFETEGLPKESGFQSVTAEDEDDQEDE